MEPGNMQYAQRLRTSLEESRRQLAPFREQRYELIKQYVGKHYSDEGAESKVPVNLVELTVNIYTTQLAARAPQANVTTRYRQLKPQAATLELALNHLAEEIALEQTLQWMVRDALFGLGIIKIGMSQSGTVEIGGFRHDVGQPFADVVDFDDWVHDHTANRYEEVQYAGNRYSVPRQWVLDNPYFDPQARLKVPVSGQTGLNEEGDERVRSLSHGSSGQEESYRDRVELWDLWLPEENKLITMPVEGGPVLRVVNWNGPEGGPYRLLSFADVPNNVMPLAPLASLRDLHDLANHVFRKLGRQAERQKVVGVVQGGAEDDAQRIMDANDGEVVVNRGGGTIVESSHGGINPSSMGFFQIVKDLFIYHAGNLDALGGLSAMSDTVGQDKMLTANASKRLADMQARTVALAKQVMEDLAFYLFTDPLIKMPLVKRLAGTDLEIPVTFSAADREGDYLDYNFDVVPYSMQDRSPGERLATLTQVFQVYLAPFAQVMAAQGVAINWPALLKQIAKLTNMQAEFDEILTFFAGEQENELQPVGTPPGGNKPPVTQRTYERINRPGATRSGKDNVLAQIMMGSRAQPDEMAALARAS